MDEGKAVEETAKEEPVAGPSVNTCPGFTVGKWGEFPRWACDLCPFDTLDGEEAMLQHIAERHAPPPTRAPIRVPILDRFGNVVTEREV